MKCLVISGILMLASATQAQKKAFGAPKIIKGARAFPGTMAVADFDLDGRTDLAVANAFALDVTNGPASTYYLDANYQVTETRNLPATGEIGLFSYPAMASADFNRDGLEDILILSDRGALSLYLNQGPTDPKSKELRFKPAFKARRIAMMAKRSNLYFYLRNGGLLIDDFDGDGQLDVALAGEMTFLNSIQGYTGVLFLPGDGKGGLGKENLLLIADIVSLEKGDLDGDGRMDLVALDATSRVHILRSQGSGRFEKTSWLSSSPKTSLILKTGDADGDGKDDILIGGGTNQAEATVYRAGSKGTWTQKMVLDLSSSKATRTESMAFEDLDGDGKADIALILSRAVNDASLCIHRSTGKNFTFLEEHTLTAILDPKERVPSHSLLRTADFDGDLNPELVVGSLVVRGNKKLVQLVFPNQSPKKVGKRIYGKGYATGAGVIPAITSFGGRPALGNKHWGVALTGTNQGNRRAALFLYHNPGGPWQGPGFSINVFPRWSIGTKTKGGGSKGGYALLPLRIPKDPYLLGRTFHFQWLIEDPGAKRSNGIAVSKAMAITFVAR